MLGLANRLHLFEQMYKNLIRHIGWSKFEHCLSAKKVQGPILITQKDNCSFSGIPEPADSKY